jgi:hypothetical protein
MNSKPIIDGIVNEKKWRNTNPKILWLLKEAHGPNSMGTWDERKFLREREKELFQYSKWKSTFASIAKTSWQILKDESYDEVIKHDLKRNVINILDNIAVINVSKVFGKSVSNYTSDKKSFSDGKKIFGQIEKIKPNIVIGGNTLWLMYANDNFFLKEKINKKIMKEGWWFIYSKILFIDADHPNQREYSQKEYCESIYNVYKKNKSEISLAK